MKDKKKNPGEAPDWVGFLARFFANAEDLFTSIVRTSPDGIVITDMEGKLVYANSNNYSMMGIGSEQEVLGTNLLDWIDPSYHEKAIANMNLLYKGVFERDNQYLLVKKNGERFLAAINSAPLTGKTGEPFGLVSIIREISNIKQIEEQLHEKGNKYKAIVDHLTEGVVMVDDNMKVIEWNEAMAAITGAPAEDTVGRPYDEVVMEFVPAESRNDEIREKFRTMTAGILATGVVPDTGMTNDIAIVCADGSRKYIRQSVFVIPVSEKFHIGSVTVDVTGRKSWEQDLRQKEIRYRLLFESANDAIFLMDERKFIDCNLKAADLFGCRKEDLIGKSPADFSPVHQPDGQSSGDKAVTYISAALEQESQSFAWQHMRLDGTLFDAEVSLNEVDLDGRKFLQAIVRDVTSRKRYEDRMRKFSECLLTFGSDVQQNINQLTRLCGEVFGATCALYNRLQGDLLCSLGQWNTPQDFQHKGPARGHICYDVITGKGAEVMVVRNLPETEYMASDPNVGKYGLKTYFGKAVFAAGEPVGSLCSVFQSDFAPDEADCHFISVIASAIGVEEERKSAQDKLITFAEELKGLNDSKDKFFSIIAHDLKGPFNAIMGFSDILTADWTSFTDDEKQHFVKNISNSAKNTFRLLENLLEWASTQTGKMAFNPVTFDLSVVANDVIILMRDQAEKKQIRLFTAVNFGTMVNADENMIRTVLRNLVSNAIKFTREGGHVKIDTEVIQPGDGSAPKVEICVHDTGIGIQPATMAKLFRIDEKIRSLGTSQEKGTGLGLILCRELVERNGGRIRAESEPGKGSRFCFTLDRA
jgi:PAS domain S-box-containing protein